MIETINLSKNYGKRCIFSDFSYVFPDKGLVAIVGESGSGKSTLLNIIAGLNLEYKGAANILRKNPKNLSNIERTEFRLKNIGYVFQNFNLINLDSAFNNVYLPIDTISKSKKSISKQRALDCLKLVEMSSFAKTTVNKLSGGEKQRVAIARALVNDPKVILCDEPTGALDEKNSQLIFNLLNKISQNKLVIVATHDVEGINGIADVILEIKDEKINVKSTGLVKNKENLLLIGAGDVKAKSRTSLSFKIRHSIQKMKAKKFRSLIVNLMLSLSLTGVGLSLIISSSVTEKVNDAFKEILNGNQIVMSLKNENENTFTSAYSASFDKVYEIYNKYQYHLDGIGVNYLINFEDFFKDRNEFELYSGSKKYSLDSLSTRNVNDFKWLDEDSDEFFYPQSVGLLDDDQIVLGLSYSDMANLCFALQIQRNFTSLGHYIYEKGLMLTLNVENSVWQYEDEQLFDVVAVKESSSSCIYHTNQLWNEMVFEEMMRLPSDDDNVHVFPWELFKIYYLKTKSDPSSFIDATLYDESLYDYVFERTNENYNPSICSANSVCDEKRVFVYSVDKYGISPDVIEDFKESGISNNYYFTSDFGYASYSSNLFSGFSKNVFLGTTQELVDQAIDADTQINRETNLEIDLPDGVVQGNFLNSLGDGLRFSTLPNKLLYGRMPTNLNEIVISSGLAEKFDKTGLCLGKYLSFAGEIEEIQDQDGNILKKYNSTKVLVVGIAEESKNYVYHSNNWTISFFRDKLGVSSFYLIPRSVVFEFGSEREASEAYQKLIFLNKEYKFTNPLEELETNVSSTLDYANTILLCFSILSTVISIFLLGTVLMLNIIEGKEENKLFYYLGISQRDINSITTYQGLVQGFIAFVVSAFELIVVDFVISYFLGDYLNIGFKFSFNYKPVLVIFVLSLMIPWLISKIMLLFLNRKKVKS